MAKIWFVREGKSPTLGDAAAEKPVQWCIDELGLNPGQWIAPLSSPRRIGKSDHLDEVKEFKHVIVELDDKDISALKQGHWKSGFYLLANISPSNVRAKLA